jgi:hypothetical protein
MRKEIVLNVIVVLTLLLLSPFLISLGIRELPKSNQKPFGDHRKVYEDAIYKTGIVGEEDNMLAIGLSFRNFNLKNKKDVSLVLLQDKVEIRRAVVNGASIDDGRLVKFRFAPVADSKGKSYEIEVSSRDSSNEDALQVYFESTGLNMNYQLFYKPKYLSIITDVYRGWFRKIASDKLFCGVYTILILGLGIVIIKSKN